MTDEERIKLVEARLDDLNKVIREQCHDKGIQVELRVEAKAANAVNGVMDMKVRLGRVTRVLKGK